MHKYIAEIIRYLLNCGKMFDSKLCSTKIKENSLKLRVFIDNRQVWRYNKY